MQEEQSWAPLAEVAAAYGVSLDTIRRRMKRGELDARREQTPQGFRWLALLPDVGTRKTAPDAPGSPRTNESALHDLDIVQRGQEELIDTLRHELALRNREISRLHEVIASQAQALGQLAAPVAPPISAETPAPDVSRPATGQPDNTAQTRQDAPERAQPLAMGHDTAVSEAPPRSWAGGVWDRLRGR